MSDQLALRVWIMATRHYMKFSKTRYCHEYASIPGIAKGGALLPTASDSTAAPPSGNEGGGGGGPPFPCGGFEDDGGAESDAAAASGIPVDA